MQRNGLGFQRMLQFAHISECHALTRFVFSNDRQVVEAENHILRRHDDRKTVCRMQNVVGRHHQNACFELCFKRQRHVNSHLVTVEVRVKRSTNERVQLDCLTFNQSWFESLNTQSVQCRRTVEQNRMLADNLIKDIPNFRTFFFNQLLRLLNSRGEAFGVKTCIDKRLEQFQSHFLRQTALVQFQLRTGHDNRTTGIVDALTEKVLTETTLLTFQHIRKRLQRTLIRTGNGTTATAVIEQRIHSFLQHTLFVTDNDARRTKLHQALQTVVTVDHTTVKVVQIGSRKTTAVQRYKRTQIRRDHRNDLHDHPLRAVAGFHEVLNDFETLHQFLGLQFRCGFGQIGAQLHSNLFEFHCRQKIINRFRTDQRCELVFTEFINSDHVFFFRKQLMLFQGSQAWFCYNVVFEIQNAFDILQRHIKQCADTRRKRFQEPDMGNRSSQFDMAHALTTHA